VLKNLLSKVVDAVFGDTPSDAPSQAADAPGAAAHRPGKGLPVRLGQRVSQIDRSQGSAPRR